MSEIEPGESTESGGQPAGFLALAIVAAAAGAAAALLLAPERKTRGKPRDQRTVAAAGFLVGAGLTALLTPQSGSVTRRFLGGQLTRIKVGAVDHIERLRLSRVPDGPDQTEVRTVQELGREPDNIF